MSGVGSDRSPDYSLARPNQETTREVILDTAHSTWKVFALFNHDLHQIFVGATDAELPVIARECEATASELQGWERRHKIDWMERVEEFPSFRHAKAYARWLSRDGAFDGVEEYSIGLDDPLS